MISNFSPIRLVSALTVTFNGIPVACEVETSAPFPRWAIRNVHHALRQTGPHANPGAVAAPVLATAVTHRQIPPEGIGGALGVFPNHCVSELTPAPQCAGDAMVAMLVDIHRCHLLGVERLGGGRLRLWEWQE